MQAYRIKYAHARYVRVNTYTCQDSKVTHKEVVISSKTILAPSFAMAEAHLRSTNQNDPEFRIEPGTEEVTIDTIIWVDHGLGPVLR